MADTRYERDYLISLYPGRDWKKRVQNMSDSQVIAIYIRKKQGEKTLKESKPNGDTGDTGPESLF